MDGYKSHASHRRSGDSVPPDQDELVFIGLDDHGIELWFNTACRMRRDRQRHAGQDDVDITLVVHIYKPYFSAGLEAFAGILKLGMRAIPIALIKIGRHTAVEASGEVPPARRRRSSVLPPREPNSGESPETGWHCLHIGCEAGFIEPLNRAGWLQRAAVRQCIHHRHPGGQRHPECWLRGRQSPARSFAPVSRSEDSCKHWSCATHLHSYVYMRCRAPCRRVRVTIDNYISQWFCGCPVGLETHGVLRIFSAIKVHVPRPYRGSLRRRPQPSAQIKRALHNDDRLRVTFGIKRRHQVGGKGAQVFDHCSNFIQVMQGDVTEAMA